MLDYAHELTNLSFDELDEIDLQGNMVHSLANGRLLLLIVSDTIRRNLLLLSESIQSDPYLEFNLAPLELHLYELLARKYHYVCNYTTTLLLVAENDGATLNRTISILSSTPLLFSFTK